MSKYAKQLRQTLLTAAMVALSQVVPAQESENPMPLPRVEHGQLIDPMPTPTPSTNYPRVEDGRLQVNKDVSVGGTLSPTTVNVRVPLPEPKSK